MIGWLKIKQAAHYAGVSERTMRNWLKDGLKHSRLPTGTVLIHVSNIDSCLDGYAVLNDRVERLVDEIFARSEKRNRK
jgi:predicted site-specific integrase-resolvase